MADLINKNTIRFCSEGENKKFCLTVPLHKLCFISEWDKKEEKKIVYAKFGPDDMYPISEEEYVEIFRIMRMIGYE